MSNSDVLKRLFPLELGGVFEADIEIEGKNLDAVQDRADDLLNEMKPERAYELLEDWERICGLAPTDRDSYQCRQDRVLAKVRERGGIDSNYYIALATSMGYEIVITELGEFMTGWSECGDELCVPESIWIWIINVLNTPLYCFEAGVSITGEYLLDWPDDGVFENYFDDIKPAHTFLDYDY